MQPLSTRAFGPRLRRLTALTALATRPLIATKRSTARCGQSVCKCHAEKFRSAIFARILTAVHNRAVAKHLDVHAICDNYKTHKTKEVQAWLAKHPRFKLHFTPTSSSWINLVERLFAEITRQQIRRGVFKSVAELEAA